MNEELNPKFIIWSQTARLRGICVEVYATHCILDVQGPLV
jgi:hypothetical protein